MKKYFINNKIIPNCLILGLHWALKEKYLNLLLQSSGRYDIILCMVGYYTQRGDFELPGEEFIYECKYQSGGGILYVFGHKGG